MCSRLLGYVLLPDGVASALPVCYVAYTVLSIALGSVFGPLPPLLPLASRVHGVRFGCAPHAQAGDLVRIGHREFDGVLSCHQPVAAAPSLNDVLPAANARAGEGTRAWPLADRHSLEAVLLKKPEAPSLPTRTPYYSSCSSSSPLPPPPPPLPHP